MYRWACEGPPVVMPLGMLAKPKAYLTSVQQVGGGGRIRHLHLGVCVCCGVIEGPPVVMPLGMLAKPKAYLTSVQQVGQARALCFIGRVPCREGDQ